MSSRPIVQIGREFIFLRLGSRVVAEALSRGHEVTAVVRDPARFREPDAAAAKAGDAASAEDVAALSAGQDLVITATRPALGREGELRPTTEALVAGVARTGVRLVDAEGNSAISMEDLAVVLLDEAEAPKHHRTRFTAAYWGAPGPRCYGVSGLAKQRLSSYSRK